MSSLGGEADHPRSFRSTAVVQRRRAMLGEPHIAGLTAYVDRLQAAMPALEFPYFDPFDGGVEAELLFVLEKPGPMTSTAGKGSGFISRNNDDPTAEAVFHFMQQAGIPRRRTVTWNVIPGWNGTRDVTTGELRGGIEALAGLLTLLPKLATIVLVGQKAQRARPLVQVGGYRVRQSPHPSPIVRASRRAEWDAIPAIWREAAIADP